jgi:hypothetical protein
VSEPTPLLGREGIEEAFRRLGDRYVFEKLKSPADAVM